jgi:DNA polymerase gamma 1
MYRRLSDEMHLKLWGRLPRKVKAYQEQLITERLTPFDLHNSVDKAEEVNLHIPNAFGTWEQEVSEAEKKYIQGYTDTLEGLCHINNFYIPSSFELSKPGWNVWKDGRWVSIKAVNGKAFFFDIETARPDLTVDEWKPVCAIGLSQRGWILWKYDGSDFIDFGHNNVVVGHNVSYDRSYLECEYGYSDTGNRFFDTMSAWIVSRGMCNQQVPLYNSDDVQLHWKTDTTGNSLKALLEFYYPNEKLNKDVREELVNNSFEDAIANFDRVAEYCARDVVSTYKVFRYLYPEYLRHKPTLVSQGSQYFLGSVRVPMNEGYYDWLESCEGLYNNYLEETSVKLFEAAKEYLENNPVDPGDGLDWTVAKSGNNKGLPKWYREVLTQKRLGDIKISKRWVPIVLGIKYKGEKVYWDGKTFRTSVEPVAHPENPGQRVTTLFSKGFVAAYEGVLSTENEKHQNIIKEKLKFVIWVMMRKRYRSVRVHNGWVVPQLVPNGTVTGRSTDKLWQVMPNAKAKKVGSEFKTQVRAPEGYIFVGADVDSQEAWLFGLLGDAQMGINGSTPLGRINLVGNKKDKTDIHNIMAKAVGMSRDNTKTRVYAAIYGQGVRSDAAYLLKTVPSMTSEAARENAILFKQNMQGSKYEGLYHGGLASESFNLSGNIANSKAPKTPLLGSLMSDALRGLDDFLPSRINWVD